MQESGFAIVVDVGKTLSKVTLWSREGRMLDRQIRPNAGPLVDGIRRLDTRGIGQWLMQALSEYSDHPIEYIVPVAHGAAVACLSDGDLCVEPLDYEQAIPADILASYRADRDPFTVTGSPALPDGLNMGVQLAWLDLLYPGALPASTLLPWAQYWAWFLSGVAVSEVTSLACHSDLWAPDRGTFSPMAQRRAWAGRFAPLTRANQVIGNLLPAIATATGLSAKIHVLAGLHDSNAALLASRGFSDFARKELTTLSTGTWFVAMRTPGAVTFTRDLAPRRDTLVNVDANCWRVPSARFMGGREIESVIEIDTRRVDIKSDQPALLAAAPALIERKTMLLPTLAPGCGPFPNGEACWLNLPGDWETNWYARRAAICLYAALVADASLDLIGSKDRLLIEGRFAEAQVFVRALAALRPDMVVHTANVHNDVSFGALRLIDTSLQPQGGLSLIEPLDGDFEAYRSHWASQIEAAA